jgi:hypothetical protein
MSEEKLFHEVPKTADFHSVVMTTFSFDFHHFEAQVLRTLKRKGVTNVNIFADTAMLDQSIGLATGHLKSVSRAYSVNAIPCKGAFHPKITILAGENDVLLLQGSGNITNGGHGKNHELFNVFYANREDQTQLPLIQEAWNYLRKLTSKLEGLTAEKLDWVSSNCNLLSESQSEKHQFNVIAADFSAALLYNEETSIWNQLANLIPSDKIKNIKVFSPFYDEKGTFLTRLGNHYSGSTIDAFLQPNKGIHPFNMEGNKQIDFYSWDSTDRANDKVAKFERKLHSKIFWFDAGDEQYCLFGSPNATNAAFGNENNRGANDEFAVLIKVNDKNIFDELKLTGTYKAIIPQENIQVKEAEEDLEKEQSDNIRKIKIVGVDQDSSSLTLYIKDAATYKKVSCVIYNHWGEEIESVVLDVTKEKIRITLSDPKKENAVAFIQLFNENEPISNKQIVNSLHDLWNTNPSVENRRLMKLGSLIESGSNGVFDVVDFYNTIQTSRSLPERTSSGGGNSGNEEAEEDDVSAASLTYEEAIALDRDSHEHKKILKQHSSIRIWDSIEKYFRDLAISEEDEDMDDEEDGDATTSREREDKKDRTDPIPLNSEKVLGRRRASIEKFLGNYLIGLQKSTQEKDHQLGLIDMAMFLIVTKHLVQFTEREVKFKVEFEHGFTGVLYPTRGNMSGLDSFSGAVLNLVGSFVNLLLSAPFQEATDEYTEKKLAHYKVLVRRTSLFCLAIVNEAYATHPNGQKWTNLLALNIIDQIGEPEKGFDKHLTDFLKNVSIKEINEVQLLNHLQDWIELARKEKNRTNYFHDKNMGICVIEKRIPNNGKPTFLKLSRPGFEYDEDKGDFILSDLFDCATNELKSSLQNYKKKQLTTLAKKS